MNRDVEREVFKRCPETCPDVDSAIDDMLSDIDNCIAPANDENVKSSVEVMRALIKSSATEVLRQALRECVSDLHEVIREADDLRRENIELKDRISNLEDL